MPTIFLHFILQTRSLIIFCSFLCIFVENSIAMKKTTIYALLLTCAFFSCSQEPKETHTELKKKVREIIVKEGEPKSIATLTIDGMSCEVNCAAKIKSTLSALGGVTSCDVDFQNKKANVVFDNTKLTEEALIAEVEKLNENQYSVKEIEVEKTIVSQVEKP